MADRETIEKNRIKNSIRENKDKNRKLHRKRSIKLAVFCTLFSIIVIIGTAFMVVHLRSDKEALREAGIAAFEEGSYNEAINDFEESLNQKQWFTQRMDEDTTLYLAACYMRTDDYQNALSKYTALKAMKSKVVSSTELEFYIDLANALINAKDCDASEKDINTLKAEYDRGNVSVSLFLGGCYQRLGKYDEMVEYYNKYVETYGYNTYVAYQLSSYYLSIDELENAISVINKGLESADDLYLDKLYYNSVIICEKQLDYESAFTKISNLVEKYPNDEIFKREYDFLDSRVNINPVPVHTKGDADQ